MKRLSFSLLALILTVPIFASDGDQSYISYDSGDTIVIQAVDNREVEVGVNSPVFAGDQLVTGRRGRVEIRLSDGNIMAVDRRSAVLFHAMQGSYSGEDNQTIAELLRGKVIVHHTDDDFVPVRLDTRSATYQSLEEAVLSIETDGYRDEVSVFGGLVEVRTRESVYRLRAGERVRVDENGIYESAGLARDGMDDFERWYLRRSDDDRGYRSRYLDTRLSYAEPMLDTYGSWVYVQDYGSWVWRPRVSVGWKPYYHGRWARGRSGALVWVSFEPWGWVPYHYGRWAYSSFYGWVWLPGSVYSPAWVYWAYGPSWVGWVPWGYYDCYTPYYRWLYRPRHTIHVGVGFGFWGRIHVSDRDLNHWVVVGPDHLVSTRIDRAALTTDRIRDRLQRDGDRATFTDTPARFTRDELRNPAEKVRTIARRIPGEGTGNGRSGSEEVDATRFFRRDPDLSNTLRDRIARSRPDDDSGREVSGRTIGESRDRSPGSVITRERGGDTPGTVSRPGVSDRTPSSSDGTTRTITRDRTPTRTRVIDRSSEPDSSNSDKTRQAVPNRSKPPTGSDHSAESDDDKGRSVSRPSPSDDRSWRDRGLDRSKPDRSDAKPESSDDDRSSSADRSWRETPVPGRVIDSIGGARLVPRDSSDSNSNVDRSRPAERRPATTSGRSSSSNRTSVTRERSPSRSSTVDRDRSSSSSRVDRNRSSSSSGSRTTTRSRSSSSGSSSTKSSSSSSKSGSSTKSSSSKSSSSSRGKVSRKKPDDK